MQLTSVTPVIEKGPATTEAGLTVMVKLVLADRLPGSVAVIITVETPLRLGVPVIMRVAASKLKLLAGLMLAV